MIKRLKNESGYSLVEVMASILILSIAIIPMVSMFDSGLRAATGSGNYDKARTLANGVMENVKAMPYNKTSTVASDSAVERFPTGANRACPVTVPNGFTCSVRTKYANDSNLSGFSDSGAAEQFMQVVVTVGWQGGGASISTTGLISGSRS